MLANIYEVKNKLSSYVDKAIKGEEVILARYNVPVARIVPIKGPFKKNRTVLGRSAKIGHIVGDVTGPFISESDWDMLK